MIGEHAGEHNAAGDKHLGRCFHAVRKQSACCHSRECDRREREHHVHGIGPHLAQPEEFPQSQHEPRQTGEDHAFTLHTAVIQAEGILVIKVVIASQFGKGERVALKGRAVYQTPVIGVNEQDGQQEQDELCCQRSPSSAVQNDTRNNVGHGKCICDFGSVGPAEMSSGHNAEDDKGHHLGRHQQ